ncbi:MAG: hypothetical protein ABEJ89_08790 [Haloarculaceae archaeon]
MPDETEARSEHAPPCPEYRAVIQRFEGQPNKCTIYVAGDEDESLLSAWITAAEGSYTHLNSVR